VVERKKQELASRWRGLSCTSCTVLRYGGLVSRSQLTLDKQDSPCTNPHAVIYGPHSIFYSSSIVATDNKNRSITDLPCRRFAKAIRSFGRWA
jgi:hypothetical protein